MAIRRICKYGEKILEKKTRKVSSKEIKKDLPDLLKDMFETLDAVGGVGLAANQIGLDLSLAVIKIKKEKEEEGSRPVQNRTGQDSSSLPLLSGDGILRIVLINPELEEKSGSMKEEEGCLSFPGLFARVKRFSKVKVRALNEKGLPIEINAEGLFSKALQHELDHLDGVVFIDRLPFLTRMKLKPLLMKLKRQWKKIDETKLKPAGGGEREPGSSNHGQT